MTGRKIIITGGAGFIGSHLSERLVEMDNDVIVYDVFNDFYDGKENNLVNIMDYENFTLIRGDILDYEFLNSSMQDVEIVFHLAAQPGVRYSLLKPVETSKVNIIGTLNVLEASRVNNVERVVNVSSSSIYGERVKLPIKETEEKTPISIYGVSKLAAEHYCRIYYQSYDMDIVSLRYFTAYGPRQRPDMAFHKFFNQIKEGIPVSIYGDGSQTRDFTYVDDIVRGTISSAETEGIAGEAFNLGSGTSSVLNDILKIFEELLGEFEVNYEPKKIGDVTNTLADITKAKKILRYSPRVSLKEGLTNLLRWFKKMPFNT